MLIESTKIVVQQILLLFLLIGVGYLCARFKILDGDAARQMTNLLLIIITPAIIINAFQESGSQMRPLNMLIAAGVGVMAHLLGALLSKFVFRKEDQERKRVFVFSTVFYNSGFFGLPLVGVVLGNLALAYVSIIVAVFNITMWTYGVYLFDGENTELGLKSLINPGVITVAIVLILYALKIELPPFVRTPIHDLARLQSPLAMIIIGVQFYLFREQFSIRDLGVWKVFFLRNLLVPSLVLPLLLLVSRDEVFILACLIAVATPTAVNTVLFATRYRRDINLAIQTVLITTLMVIVTIPLVIILTQWLLTF